MNEWSWSEQSSNDNLREDTTYIEATTQIGNAHRGKMPIIMIGTRRLKIMIGIGQPPGEIKIIVGKFVGCSTSLSCKRAHARRARYEEIYVVNRSPKHQKLDALVAISFGGRRL